MRKIRKNRIKKQRKIIIVSALSLLLIMVTGYAAFNTNLNITARGNINSKSIIYVSSTGSDDNGDGTKDKPYQTISQAYKVATLEATIYVMDNLTIDETITFDKDKIITITSEDNEINSLLRGEENESLLLQTAGETTLANVILDGQNKAAQLPLIIGDHCILNLNEGTTIKNNIDSQDAGGGVGVRYSTLNIDGAKIINNQAQAGGGGGILSNYSNITMINGEISGNKAQTGGGIYFVFKNDDYGLLTINGGKICNNTTSADGGGIAVGSADIIINDGEISSNSANNGGGIIVFTHGNTPDVIGTIIMKNGKIINNTAVSTWKPGGGALIQTSTGCTYDYEGGTVSNNTPTDINEF